MAGIDIKSMSLDELNNFLAEIGVEKFRGKQIFSWLHQKTVLSFDEMTNLSNSLREKLKKIAYITSFTLEKKLVSKLDGTKKYLFKLSDGEFVETVLMKYEHGNSICISSQVGCRMGCEFCASTKAGFVRHLKPSEILEQVYAVMRESGEKISNIVLMGIGEPLDNFDNVMRFLEIINSKDSICLSHRHISLSTCGLVQRIYDLADMNLQITLSISLHATDDETRSKIMPVNKKYNINELLKACKYYTDKTNRRISYEYSLIKGVNDSKSEAECLAKLLKGMLCHVNLIPINYVKEAGFEKSLKESVYAFQKVLSDKGINATVRRTLGADIDAACGQLRRQQQKEVNAL